MLAKERVALNPSPRRLRENYLAKAPKSLRPNLRPTPLHCPLEKHRGILPVNTLTSLLIDGVDRPIVLGTKTQIHLEQWCHHGLHIEQHPYQLRLHQLYLRRMHLSIRNHLTPLLAPDLRFKHLRGQLHSHQVPPR